MNPLHPTQPFTRHTLHHRPRSRGQIFKWSTLLAVACLVLVGCATTRSISNSAVNPAADDGVANQWPTPPAASHADPGYEYRGELNEFDVLGLDRSHIPTEDEIARAVTEAKEVRLRRGHQLLLIQSGAVIPDGPMIAALEKDFKIVPFSGVPPKRTLSPSSTAPEGSGYARSLRLAAARAGADTIVCYWGSLESARRKMETKTISWVPVAGWLIPDETQHMRIRLKIALIDVRTGNWRMVTPEPFTDRSLSTAFTRDSSDQKQVELLKGKAYVATAQKLTQEFAAD